MGTRLLPTPMEEAGMAAHPGASAVRQGKGRLDCQLGPGVETYSGYGPAFPAHKVSPAKSIVRAYVWQAILE